MKDKDILWACPEHYHIYDPGLPTIPEQYRIFDKGTLRHSDDQREEESSEAPFGLDFSSLPPSPLILNSPGFQPTTFS
jgi:hypothetical protein